MTKSIYTLIPDIKEIITRKDGWFTDEIAVEYGNSVGRRIKDQLGGKTYTPSLRLSKMGPTCPKALWHSIHTPQLAEPLPPWAEVKYAFGHMIEALAICLAKAAGHDVVGEQDEIKLDGIVGHRDCVIDGCTVDVKSSSSRGFSKFKGNFEANDGFGYLDQLDGYVVGSSMDPLVTVKDRGYLLVIDKQLGHMVLYEHIVREDSIRSRIQDYKEIVDLQHPPKCQCRTIPIGASGNVGLDLKASYSPYKQICFPLLRTFLYRNGPVYLTKVVRKPEVTELFRPRGDRYAQVQVPEELSSDQRVEEEGSGIETSTPLWQVTSFGGTDITNSRNT